MILEIGSNLTFAITISVIGLIAIVIIAAKN